MRTIAPPPEQPRGGSDRAAVEPEIGAYRDGLRIRLMPRRAAAFTASRRPAADMQQSTSADPSAEAGRVGEVERRDAVRLPPRIIRIPYAPQRRSGRMMRTRDGPPARRCRFRS